MSIKTYKRNDEAPERPWPLWLYTDDGKLDKDTKCVRPGDWVALVGVEWINNEGSGRGIVVSVTQDEVVVLWSVEPQTGFVLPALRRVSNTLVANKLVSIQPMPTPAASIFYMNYHYGSGSLGTEPTPDILLDATTVKEDPRKASG